MAQQWAHRLWQADFDGVYYAARHDPQFTERSVAVFGEAGDQTQADTKRFEHSTSPIPDRLRQQLADEFAIAVVSYRALPHLAGDET